jgi:tryptophan synthase beta chain
VNLSGRGDKDMETAGKYFDILDAAALADSDLAAVRSDELGTGASE